MTENHARSLLLFLRQVGRLKSLKRTGWLDRGLPADNVESVADHSFRVALLAWLAAADDPELDRDRVLKLALVHDLAEALTGDWTPYARGDLNGTLNADRRAFLNQRHGASEARAREKRAAEEAAFLTMTAELAPGLQGELRELWREMAERTTPESRFVKQVDRLETYLQSVEYQALDPVAPMDSFRLEVQEKLDSPGLIELRDEIEAGSQSGTDRRKE